MKTSKNAIVERTAHSTATISADHDPVLERTDGSGVSTRLGEPMEPVATSNGPAIAVIAGLDELERSALQDVDLRRQGLNSSHLKKLGIAGFLFFTLKGMLWLVAGYAAIKANGCVS